MPAGGYTEFNCVIRSSSGILNPRIELETALTTVPLYNYAYIPDFGRYYFVTEITFTERLWIIDLKVDVLATYRAAIGGSTLYVLRSAAEYDGAIVDNMYPLKTDYSFNMTEQTENPWWAIQPAATSGCYVVGVRGRVETSQTPGGITYLVMTPAEYKTFTEKLFSEDLSSYIPASDPSPIGESLTKMIFNPAQYIASVMWLPGTPSEVSAATSSWRVGFWTLGMSLPILNPASRLLYSAQINIAAHPQSATRGKYMNTEPATDRLLYLPRCGFISLNDPIFAQVGYAQGYLAVTLQVDPISGEGLYTLSAGGVTFDEIHCQIGVSIPLASNEFTMQDAIGAVTSAGTSAISAALDVGSGNMAGAVINSGAAISSALAVLQPHIVQLSGASGYLGLVNAGICRIYSIFRTATQDDNTENGRPLCQNKQISTIPGFIQVLNGDIEAAQATATELDEIRRLLETGFYYA